MKRRNWIIVILVVLTIAENGLFAQPKSIISTSFQEDIEKLMLEKNVPALGVGIIEDGVLQQVKVYGELKKQVSAPVNSIFNVASLTKPVVTMLTLLLVSNGDWDLDDPLATYWIDPDVKDDPLHKKLTTRHVLTHQTGFDNWRRMSKTKKLTFNCEPGSKCKYSGEGFEYLKLALENKFGKTLEELTDSLIFKPYGMKNTRFWWDENMDETRYAVEHNKEGLPYKPWKRKDACAADDLLTTIEDYGVFAVNALSGVGLSEDVYQEMISPQAIISDTRSYGLGWYIKHDVCDSEFVLTHTGGDMGVATLIMLLPKSKRGIIVFTNGDNGFDIIEKVEAGFLASES